MEAITINLEDVCGAKIYTRDDGHVLYDKIAKALPSSDKVIVAFNNKEIASESFLDEAIVEHYIHPLLPDASKRIFLNEVARSDQVLMSKIYAYRMSLEKKAARKRA